MVWKFDKLTVSQYSGPGWPFFTVPILVLWKVLVKGSHIGSLWHNNSKVIVTQASPLMPDARGRGEEQRDGGRGWRAYRKATSADFSVVNTNEKQTSRSSIRHLSQLLRHKWSFCSLSPQRRRRYTRLDRQLRLTTPPYSCKDAKDNVMQWDTQHRNQEPHTNQRPFKIPQGLIFGRQRLCILCSEICLGITRPAKNSNMKLLVVRRQEGRSTWIFTESEKQCMSPPHLCKCSIRLSRVTG